LASRRRRWNEKLSTTEARVSISGATVQILEHDALEISVPEPLWQGTLAGGVIGAALGGLAQQTGEAYGCILVSSSHCESGQPVAGYLVGAVLGSAFGAGLDAVLWKRTKVFTAPGGAPARVVVPPVLSRRTGGFQVTATF
jgi:hypothetical protein